MPVLKWLLFTAFHTYLAQYHIVRGLLRLSQIARSRFFMYPRCDLDSYTDVSGPRPSHICIGILRLNCRVSHPPSKKHPPCDDHAWGYNPASRRRCRVDAEPSNPKLSSQTASLVQVASLPPQEPFCGIPCLCVIFRVLKGNPFRAQTQSTRMYFNFACSPSGTHYRPTIERSMPRRFGADWPDLRAQTNSGHLSSLKVVFDT